MKPKIDSAVTNRRIRQDKFIAGITSGMSGVQAKEYAGYSKDSKVSELMRVPHIAQKIAEILDKRGITDEWLADQYFRGAHKALDGEEPDLNSHAQYLKQIGYLRGHGKPGPAVAVQINNSSGKAEVDGPGEIGELVTEVRDLVAGIREEIADRQSDGLHVRSLEIRRTETSENVDSPSTNPLDVSGRGG